MLLKRPWRSLRLKIIAWSFVPTTIILLVVALVAYYAYQRVAEDLVIGRNRELTRLSAGQLAASLTEEADVLAALARTADIYRGDPLDQHAALRQARNRLAVFDAGVVILDGHGRVVAAEPERPEIIGRDWSSRAYYRQLLRASQPGFSNIEADGPQNMEVIVVAVPITDDRGEFRGALTGMFQLGAKSVSAFYGGIVKLRIGESGSTYIVDGNGRLIYHTDGDRIGVDVSTQRVVQEVLQRRVGDLRLRDPDGMDVAASFAPVPGTTWGLATEEDWDVLMSSSQRYGQFLLLLLGMGVLVPTLVVTVGVGRITGPIGALIRAAQEVAGGKFGQTIEVPTGDELEDLARQFNTMSAQLQESYADMERRVADRTKELATLNAIAAVVSQSLDLNEILHDALDKTMEITPVESGGAFRLDDKGRDFLLVAHRGVSSEVVDYLSRMPLAADVTGQVATRGEPVVTPVADLDESDLKGILTREGLQLIVSVPLLAKGRMLGLINLGSRNLRPPAAEELSLLAGIGHQIGVAVENARLYQQAERSAAAAERNRLARDLHDAVSQTLFSASLIAEVLPRLWERNPDEGRRRLAELRQLTRGALAEMRTLLLELRPTALTEAALADLLRQLAEAITGRARVPISVTVEGQRPLPPDVQVALYRIAQEALNNVAKHAGAGEAVISLRCGPDRVELSVSDDGRGFDAALVSPDHLGLGIMRERAEAIGAMLAVTSQPGHGTHIEVVWQEPAPPEKLG